MRCLLYVGLFLGLSIGHTYSQSCCSGGVPVSSNLGFESGESGDIQLSISGDFNFLTRLYSESEILDDRLRKRTTQSALVRSAYTISPRFTVEGFLSYVRQTRKIYTNQNGSDFESSEGLGDPVLLLIYTLIRKPVNVRIGGGPQFPLGPTDRRNDQDLFLVEDLQPGSGAWDWILFSSLEYPLLPRPSALFYLNSIIARNGTNQDSRGGRQHYKFGDDLQFIGGYGDQFFVLDQIWNGGLAIRYRSAKRDEVDGFPNSGTGGNFLFLRLSSGIVLPSDKGSININAEWPLYTRVNDTQLAPSFSVNIAYFKKFQRKKQVDTTDLPDLISLDGYNKKFHGLSLSNKAFSNANKRSQ